jgi:ribonuclease HI
MHDARLISCFESRATFGSTVVFVDGSVQGNANVPHPGGAGAVWVMALPGEQPEWQMIEWAGLRREAATNNHM